MRARTKPAWHLDSGAEEVTCPLVQLWWLWSCGLRNRQGPSFPVFAWSHLTLSLPSLQNLRDPSWFLNAGQRQSLSLTSKALHNPAPVPLLKLTLLWSAFLHGLVYMSQESHFESKDHAFSLFRPPEPGVDLEQLQGELSPLSTGSRELA